jgi:hypothetical protein
LAVHKLGLRLLKVSATLGVAKPPRKWDIVEQNIGAMTLSLMTFSITTLSITTISIMVEHCYSESNYELSYIQRVIYASGKGKPLILCHYYECRYAECQTV